MINKKLLYNSRIGRSPATRLLLLIKTKPLVTHVSNKRFATFGADRPVSSALSM